MTAIAVGVVVALAGGALADEVSNNVDATVDSTYETLSLNANGAGASVSYAINPTNGDGKSGCNLTGSTVLTVSVNTSDSAVATVSPTSLTFDSCGDIEPITVTPHSAGTADITLSQTANSTGGTFDLATAAFSVNVAEANTAPVVTISGVTNGGDYSKGSVPTAVCHVTDAEDGLSDSTTASTPTLSVISGPDAIDGIGQQTATCSYTDGGGLNTTASATYTISDPSAPSIDYVLDPASPDGSNGWYTSDVTLTWTVTENESPNSLQKTGCDDQSITADQPSTDYSCSATSAGGSAGPVTVSIKRDATKPTIGGSASPAANANGWNNSDVTVSYTCDDNLSGVASCGPDETLSSEGSDQSSTGTAVDNAGNSDTATVSGINIDKTAPSVSLVGGPADGATYYYGFVPAAPTCSASDALSGLDGTCSVSGYGDAVGTHTVTASATDKAGNPNSASATYTVLAWTLNGFYQPVDMNGVYNIVKNGSTVPLKFEIFAGTTELTDVADVKSLTYAQTACDATAITDDVETTATGGTSLRYDTTAGQFVYNWKTPSTAGKCYRVTMTTQDGSSLVAFFKLK